MDFRLHTAAAWRTLRSCFHAQFDNPHKPPGARATDMALDADTGLTNVVLWDSAFLVLTRPATANARRQRKRKAVVPNVAALSTGMKLWARVTWHSDSGGLPQPSSPSQRNTSKQAIAWYADGLGQRLAIRYAEQPFAEVYAARPHSSLAMPCACGALCSRDLGALQVRQNPTGAPPRYRQTALTLGSRALVGGRAVDRGHQKPRC